MKARLYYKQNSARNSWYFFFGDWYTMKQITRAFYSKGEALQYAIDNGIEYAEECMMSIFV